MSERAVPGVAPEAVPRAAPEDYPASVRRVQTVAHVLDESIRIPGTDRRIGLDPILGILPVSGDLVSMIGSLYIVAEGKRLGVPRSELLKMLALIGIDVAVGSIPLLGPVFDAVWKVNKWNALRIEEFVGGTADSSARVIEVTDEE